MYRTWPQILLSCLLVACGTIAPPKLDPKLRPIQDAASLKALESAVECEAPAVARVKLNDTFKYGCFCGKGHPAIAPANASDSDDKLIPKFLAIRPIDSIDEACRDHDVCWLLRGSGDGMCNEEFRDRLEYIGRELRKDRVVDSLQWRCDILASDMASVFLSILVEDKWNSESAQFGSRVGRLIVTSFGWIAVGFRAPIWSGNPYPVQGERCNVARLEVKLE